MFKNQKLIFYIVIGLFRLTNASLFTVYFLYLTNVLHFTYAQALMLDLPLFVTQFVLELPTGFFADKYGLKKSILISFVLLSLTSLTYFVTTNYAVLFVSGVFYGAGWAFFSGAFEAFAVELFKDDTKKYFTNKQIIENLISIVAPIIVIWGSQFIGYRIFYFFDFAIKIIIFILISFRVQNISYPVEMQRFSIEFFRFGFATVVKELKRSKAIFYSSIAYLIMGFALVGLDSFWVKMIAVSTGEKSVGIVFSLASVIAVASGIIISKVHKINRLFWISSLFNAICIVLAGIFYGEFVVIIFILLRSLFISIFDTTSAIVINRIIEKERATILSLFSFLSTTGRIIATFFIGSMADNFGIGKVWIFVGLLFAFMSWLFYLVQRE